MIRFLLFVAAGFSAGSGTVAQEAERPLGDLIETLPPPEDEAAPPAREVPVAPIVRPPPAVEPGRVGTTDLPPSAVLDETDVAELTAPADPVVPIVAPPSPANDSAALQEQRRQEINAVEAPVVANLNAAQVARQEETRRQEEAAQADYARSVAEREEAIRASEAEYQAALAAHDERVKRERAEYEARVAACLDGDREACGPR